jgi:hypothetical protein
MRCASAREIIKKNYASVINWIRSLARNRRRLGISVHLVRASSHKLQAASHKLNQNLVQVLKMQGASLKLQAAGFKLQATSIKLHDILPLIKFYKVKGEGLN